MDNQGAGCTADSECDTDQVCRDGTEHGSRCVPEDPVFMGTYLLVAGEENVVCIHHWCPEWKDRVNADGGYDGENAGFVHDEDNLENNCTSPDSIHFKIAATALVCRQEGYLQPCSGGCGADGCNEHPCFSENCPGYCPRAWAGATGHFR